MKIKRVEPIAVSFPMKKPVVMAGVEIRRADNVMAVSYTHLTLPTILLV